jgi:hypothetical protein
MFGLIADNIPLFSEKNNFLGKLCEGDEPQGQRIINCNSLQDKELRDGV